MSLKLSRIQLFLVGFLLLGGFLGCQNSPGGIASPRSDIHIVGLAPKFLNPKESSSSSTTSSSTASGTAAAKEVTLPGLNIFFNITNGVSVFLDSYRVNFLAPNGTVLASGTLDFSGTTAYLVQAPTLSEVQSTGTNTQTGTTSGTDSGTFSGKSSGYISLEVLTPKLYVYMANGTQSDYFDDVTPVVANIVVHGRDVNDNELTLQTMVTISTSIEESASGN